MNTYNDHSFEEAKKRQNRELKFLKELRDSYQQINDPLPKDVVKQEIIEAISMLGYIGEVGTTCDTTTASEKQELRANIIEARQTADQLLSILIEKLQF